MSTISERLRDYTVQEVDALHRVCEDKWLFGAYRPPSPGPGGIHSRAYRNDEKAQAVREMVREHMMAGRTAEDLISSERP